MVFAVYDDVYHCGGGWSWWHQHNVDDVHHTVVGSNVRYCDSGVVDHDRSVHDGNADVSTVQGGEGVAVHEVGAERSGAHHVVGEDVSEVFQGEEVIGCDAELCDKGRNGVVGWSKDGEWTVTGQCAGKVSLDDGSFKQRMVVAVYHHVDHGGLG